MKPWEFFEVSSSDIVVDLGAFEGEKSTIPLAERARIVIALEPVFENFKHLLRTIKRDNLSNVIPLMFAVSDKTGMDTITITAPFLSSSLEIPRDGPDRKVITITWDDLINILELKRIDLVKVDIEGSEIKWLKGMTQTFPEKVLFEHHWRYPEISERETRNLLKEKGYRIIEGEGLYLYLRKEDD